MFCEVGYELQDDEHEFWIMKHEFNFIAPCKKCQELSLWFRLVGAEGRHFLFVDQQGCPFVF